MIKHVQIQTNFHSIMLGDSTTLYFSYETLIAIRHNGKLHISQNEWGTTTGKHLNWINNDKPIRIKSSEVSQIAENIISSGLK